MNWRKVSAFSSHWAAVFKFLACCPMRNLAPIRQSSRYRRHQISQQRITKRIV